MKKRSAIDHANATPTASALLLRKIAGVATHARIMNAAETTNWSDQHTVKIFRAPADVTATTRCSPSHSVRRRDGRRCTPPKSTCCICVIEGRTSTLSMLASGSSLSSDSRAKAPPTPASSSSGGGRESFELVDIFEPCARPKRPA